MKNKVFFVFVTGALILAFSGCTTGKVPAADKTVNTVVVGSGIAGSMAAISALDNGAGPVLIIEKQGYTGGTTRLAGGIFSHYNARTDYPAFLARYQASLEKLTPGFTLYPDWDKLQTVISEAADTVDYINAQGDKYLPDGDKPILDIVTDGFGSGSAFNYGAGISLVNKLGTVIKERGIELYTGCKAEEIIVENGAIWGIRAAYQGKVYYIKAKNVILATGGFSKNPELVSEWAAPNPGLVRAVSLGDIGNTGEGILMAKNAGAKIYDRDTFTDVAYLQFSEDLYRALPGSRPGGFAPNVQVKNWILVNSEGSRFVKEDLPTADVGHWIVKQGNENVWVIFSSADVPEGIGTATGNFTFKALFEAGLAADGLNEVKKADTIEALAAAIGAPKLAATVAAYNSSASTDAAFGKAPQYLANKYLRNGPFYAVQVYANAWGSMGGVVTDDSGRALRVDGSVIPHLYAVGEMANRDFYGETYIGGSSLALYSTMGRRAGAAAAKDD